MAYIIAVLRQEHCNIESRLRVERELIVFDRGERPDYEVGRAVIDYFKEYPDYHPKEDMIVEKLKARDPVAAATIGDLEAFGRIEAHRAFHILQLADSCVNCEKCERDLACASAGMATPGWKNYCPNANTLEAMSVRYHGSQHASDGRRNTYFEATQKGSC
jgi:hypothetical protein